MNEIDRYTDPPAKVPSVPAAFAECGIAIGFILYVALLIIYGNQGDPLGMSIGFGALVVAVILAALL